jgi:hypothetical protein
VHPVLPVAVQVKQEASQATQVLGVAFNHHPDEQVSQRPGPAVAQTLQFPAHAWQPHAVEATWAYPALHAVQLFLYCPTQVLQGEADTFEVPF